MGKSAYETDFYGWANEQAAMLRSGRLEAADIANIAEEIESMGKSEKRELISRLAALLTHLLKWRYQPAGRGSSWSATIKVQRRGLRRHLEDNPTLKPLLGKALEDAFQDATVTAGDETNLGESAFPSTCPWSVEELFDDDFWPEA